MPGRHRTASLLLLLPCGELPPCQAATAPRPSSSPVASRRRAIGEQGQGGPLLPPPPLRCLQTKVQRWGGGLQPVPLPRRSIGPAKGTTDFLPLRMHHWFHRLKEARCALDPRWPWRRVTRDTLAPTPLILAVLKNTWCIVSFRTNNLLDSLNPREGYFLLRASGSGLILPWRQRDQRASIFQDHLAVSQDYFKLEAEGWWLEI